MKFLIICSIEVALFTNLFIICINQDGVVHAAPQENEKRHLRAFSQDEVFVTYSSIPEQYSDRFRVKHHRDQAFREQNGVSTKYHNISDGRIVGGNEVHPPGKYSYQVAALSGSKQVCGASLIAPDLVLCAAHCSPYVDNVQIGRHDLSDNTERYERFSIVQEIKHPEWDSNTMNNDFMVLKLSGSSSYVPVSLDDGSVNLTAESDLTVIGWGTTSSGGSQSKVLQEVTLDYLTNAECNIAYGSGITSEMMCAATPAKDSCQGDSGGPLIEASSGKQVGVVSWGAGCADPVYPGVYARVSTAYDWIAGFLNNDNTTKCTDESKWTDIFGDGCEWYESNDSNCTSWGTTMGSKDMAANQACCTCGGGST